jgi:hypothetical protein
MIWVVRSAVKYALDSARWGGPPALGFLAGAAHQSDHYVAGHIILLVALIAAAWVHAGFEVSR